MNPRTFQRIARSVGVSAVTLRAWVSAVRWGSMPYARLVTLVGPTNARNLTTHEPR